MLNKSLFISLLALSLGLPAGAQQLTRPYKDLSTQSLVDQLKENYLAVHDILNRSGQKSASKEVVSEISGSTVSGADNEHLFSFASAWSGSNFSGRQYQLTGGEVWAVKVVDTARMKLLVAQLQGDNDGSKVVYSEALGIQQSFQSWIYNAQTFSGAISTDAFTAQIQNPITTIRGLINEIQMRGRPAFSSEQASDIVTYVTAAASTKIVPTMISAQGGAYEGYVDANSSPKHRHYGYFLAYNDGSRAYSCNDDDNSSQGLPSPYRCANKDSGYQSMNDEFIYSGTGNSEYIF